MLYIYNVKERTAAALSVNGKFTGVVNISTCVPNGTLFPLYYFSPGPIVNRVLVGMLPISWVLPHKAQILL